MKTIQNVSSQRALGHLALALSLATAGALTAGCAQPDSDGASDIAELQVEQLTEAAARNDRPALEPFKTIKLASGRTVQFFDLGDGDIGMGEVGPTGPSAVGVLTAQFEATPLEVFMALSGGEPAPARLIDAHAGLVASKGRGNKSARQLPGENDLVPTGLQDYPVGKCATWLGTSWYWSADWANTYSATRDVVASTVQLNYDLYMPGRAFYAGGQKVVAANMGICVDDLWAFEVNSGGDQVGFRVYAKTSGSASGCGDASWGSPIYYTPVDQDQSANFFTSSFSGKFVCATMNSIEVGAAVTETRDVGFATAYDLPLGLGM